MRGPAALRSWPGGAPETCRTASGSVTETAAVVDSAAVAADEDVVAGFVAAEFAVFGSDAGCVVAAVLPLSCQTEVIGYRTLWLSVASLPPPAGLLRLEGTLGVAAVEAQALHTASPQIQSRYRTSPARGPLWAPGGTAGIPAAAESRRAQRKSWRVQCPASGSCLRALCWERQEPGLCQGRLRAETGCWRTLCFYVLQSCLGSAGLDTGRLSAENTK